MAAKTKTEPMTLGNMLCGRPYRSGRSPARRPPTLTDAVIE